MRKAMLTALVAVLVVSSAGCGCDDGMSPGERRAAAARRKLESAREDIAAVREQLKAAEREAGEIADDLGLPGSGWVIVPVMAVAFGSVIAIVLMLQALSRETRSRRVLRKFIPWMRKGDPPCTR
jgi:hypothetical protein